MDVLKRLEQSGIVPVVVLDDAKDAVPTARALLAGGVDVMEITFRTAAAADSIRAVSEQCPDMLVGAGTVTAKAPHGFTDWAIGREETRKSACLPSGAIPSVTPKASISLSFPRCSYDHQQTFQNLHFCSSFQRSRYCLHRASASLSSSSVTSRFPLVSSISR